MTDLRGFLDRVRAERPADLIEVTARVDPRFQTAAIVTKLEERKRSPILVFRDVVGTDLPVVTNVCGSMGRIAMALSCPLRDVSARYAAAAQAPIAPRLVTDGPVHAHVLRGDAVDLTRLPALAYHEGDAPAAWITAAIVAARDPETGVCNLSFHRMMRLDRRRTTIYMEPGRHLHAIHGKYAARGEAMPVAVILGVHPTFSLGTLYAGPADVDEFAVAGALAGVPVDVVTTVTGTGLPVPAGAEIVLEGHVSATARASEGPFGEFTGYGTGTTHSPIFECDAIAHRDAPMFQDIVSGALEHLLLSMPALEHRTLRDARAACPAVTRIALPAPLTSVVAIAKTHDDQPRQVIDALLSGDIYAKQVIVVDDDVDPGDLRAVLSAMALSTQADRDVAVLADRACTPLDPSCPGDDGRGAKLGIDATRKLGTARSITRNRIPADVLDAVDVDALLGKR